MAEPIITWLGMTKLVVYWLLVVLPSILFVMICGEYETHELKKAPRCALLWRLPNLMGIKMFC